MKNKKTDRNIRLFEDWTRGMSNADLAKKYEISQGRVSQIAKQVLIERRKQQQQAS